MFLNMAANIADTHVLIQRWLTAALQREHKTAPAGFAGQIMVAHSSLQMMQALTGFGRQW